MTRNVDPYSILDTAGFLESQPKMAFKLGQIDITLEGIFEFSAEPKDLPLISDSYNLQIRVPAGYPFVELDVIELGRRIPRTADNHVNRDGTLCLGSRLRILTVLSGNYTLRNYAEKCIEPFLYSASHKSQRGGRLVFDELQHGHDGQLDDYVDLFGVKTRKSALLALEALGMKHRIANKRPCPCGCGKRLGACDFRLVLERHRNTAPRCWFREHATELTK